MAGSKKSNRREEILQALAQMLESTEGASRITTAKLAKQVGVSEAALYRHFPSKARMFEGLIEFIEEALMTRINRILDDEKDTLERIRMVMHLILAFSERNPGLTRILSGHALMFENERYAIASTNCLNVSKHSFVRSCVNVRSVKANRSQWKNGFWQLKS